MTGHDLRHWLGTTRQTHRQFAQRMGIGYTTLKRWMSGQAPIPRSAQIVIAALQEGRLTWKWIDEKSGLEKSPASGTIAAS